jgi:hypothetical protein
LAERRALALVIREVIRHLALTSPPTAVLAEEIREAETIMAAVAVVWPRRLLVKLVVVVMAVLEEQPQLPE